MHSDAELFLDCRSELGEGPFWHGGRKELFWFDILNRKLHAVRTDATAAGSWAFERYSSAAGVIDSDRLLIASAGGLAEFSLSQGALGSRAAFETNLPENRSNDGRVHPSGTFWIGTMDFGADASKGSVYAYRHGVLSKLLGGITVTNAICFSPSGDLAYFADTPTQKILKVALDPATGMPNGQWETFVDFSEGGFYPDGAVVDAEGYVWNAQWGGSRAVRIAPDGTLDRIVSFPVSNVTCPAFGGLDLKTLYFTSARSGLDADGLAAQPHAGSLFSISVDVPGQAEAHVAL